MHECVCVCVYVDVLNACWDENIKHIFNGYFLKNNKVSNLSCDLPSEMSDV